MTLGLLQTTGVLLALALIGCGGEGSGPPASTPAPTPIPMPTASAVAGLDRRPSNATCVAPPRPDGTLVGAVERVFPELTFELPVAALQAPGDDSRWYVLEKRGRVMTFPNDVTVHTPEVFVDLRGRVDATFDEAGLLGMAFHPQFAANDHVFLSYTRTGDPLVSVVARFRVDAERGGLDPDSETVILELAQPTEYHNGGGIAFGPDGFLYVAFGNGGVTGSSQDRDDWFGSMLRIDVDAAEPYAIPPDNPFARSGGRPEIYAWGLRNPWGWGFDRVTSELWLADVGEAEREEIDRVRLGGNYGWPIAEGTRCNQGTGCDGPNLLPPVVDYAHGEGCSVTGGRVYRGSAYPALAGRYVYGDLCSGFVWALERGDAGVAVSTQLLVDTELRITAFAEAVDGELYVVDLAGGLYRLTATHRFESGSFPLRLADSGCVDPSDPSRPSAGMIPYDVNVPFWSDAATKERWLALPDGSAITVGADGDWELPAGSVLLKHFRRDDRLIETRLLVRHTDGAWAGYGYEWDEAGREAHYVAEHTERASASGDWIYPSGGECLACHTEAAGRTLGLETAQMNREVHYAETGRTANQLDTFTAIGLFAVAPEPRPALSVPGDPDVGVEAQARAYLHANCSQCHRPGGVPFVTMDLRASVSVAAMGVCDVPPSTNIGEPGLLLLAPGDPGRSMIPARMGRSGGHAMPPLGRTTVDAGGLATVDAWIASLTACP